MRSSRWSLVVAVVLGSVFVSSTLAQQPSGPATLENLVTPDGAPKPPATPEAKASNAVAVRPAGTLVRPADGVQHPDLDKAWADYDAVVVKASEGIKAAVAKQFDAATSKGDLDAAERWQAALEKFRKAGELPTEKAVQTVISEAITEFKDAGGKLTNAYEAVVKALTVEQRLAEAKRVRAEKEAVSRIFLSHLPEHGFNAGPHKSFSKNGLDPEGKPLSVQGVRATHGIWLHPPTKGFSIVTFDVPDSASRMSGSVAMNDSTRDQSTPLTFVILNEKGKPLWTSKPIRGRGVVEKFDIPLGTSRTVTLQVQCPGANRWAHAVWVDPHFSVK